MKTTALLLCCACACSSKSPNQSQAGASGAAVGGTTAGQAGRTESEPSRGGAVDDLETIPDATPPGGSDGGEQGGVDGMPDAGPTSFVSDAWPREISPGRAVMFYGESLKEVDRVQLGSLEVEVPYADDSKLVIVVPDDAELGSVSVALRFRNQVVSQQLRLQVVPVDDVLPNSPTIPIIPSFYDTVSFPPISDQWRDECKFPDIPADQYVFNVDKIEGDELSFSGTVFYFHGPNGSNNADSPLSASFSRRTGLVHFENLSSTFVGLFSATEKSYLLRMVLFPVTRGNQRVLLGCSQTLADAAGVECPSIVTVSTGLSDAPTTCIE